MSLIHLYTNKNEHNESLLNLLKINNLDFLEYKLNESDISFYNIKSIPAIKFKDTIMYDLNENNIKIIYDQFITYIDTLPSVNKNTNYNITKDFKTQDNKLTREIRLNTIHVINKDLLYQNVKKFSEKYKS